eukprot:TRINITY_DN18872_c0_g1_i1.p1 TRINITY_DN18872_c0_g1~~TRINITY_DN18872_c0_g1_i1.p1  ORF type:complete len:241 (-),score=51.87 TRINITY_DN18872_c0_g1_i1:70-744(-)
MDAALALLSEEEEEEEHEDGEKKAEADEEEGEPASKRLRSETPRLDFSALQRAGYAANAETDAGNGGPEEAGGDEAIAERRKLLSAFSSLERQTAQTHEQAEKGEMEIPGCATTFRIEKEGDPVRAVASGCKVIVHATGTLRRTGKVFWTTREDPRGPHLFLAGSGKKVPGWEHGVLGMRIGEIRRLRVPGHEGYGAHGLREWSIPPHADLEFVIECLDIAAAE